MLVIAIGDWTATEFAPRATPDQDDRARTLLHRLRDEPPQLRIADAKGHEGDDL